MEDYDADRKYPCFGFGGSRGYTSMCFALGGNPSNPDVIHECAGIDGIVQAYKKGLKEWTLSGPTNFRDVIRKAIELSKNQCYQMSQHYYVLMIITDGEISDMEDTVDAIIDASEEPLSIIIVGVGSSSFSNMNELDSDDKPLQSKRANKWTQRDIVQFVPFRQFKNNPQMIAEETLKEVPRQVSDFMMLRGIVPNAKIQYSAAPIMMPQQQPQFNAAVSQAPPIMMQ